MPVNLKNQKEEHRAALMRSLSLSKSTRAIVINTLDDPTLSQFLREWAHAIGVALLDYNIDSLAWADAILVKDWKDISTPHIDKNIIVPIGPEQGSKESGFTEFNPMKFEGNAFLFSSESPYAIFAALVRYLENIKYPGDKRTLLKNISWEKGE